MGTAGYNTTVKKGGTATAFTTEACGNVSGNQFQITDTAKRIWDRATLPTFYEDAVPIASSDVSDIDYFTGKVTFATSKSGAVTVTGKYIPVTAIAGVDSVSVSLGGAVHDDTPFNSAGFHTRLYGLRDVSVNLGRFDDLSKDLYNLLLNRTIVLLEVQPGNSGAYMRGWFYMESNNINTEVDGVVKTDVVLQLDANDDSIGNDISFSYDD